MAGIWSKIKADLLTRPAVTALILVTLITSSTLLTLALATLSNISGPYDRAFEDLNAAHVWLYLDRSQVGPRDVDRLDDLPGVAGSTALRHEVTARVQIGEDKTWLTLGDIPARPGAVNRVQIQQGRYLEPDQDEVLASSAVVDLYRVAPGDQVEITGAEGQKVSLPVVGLAYDPMWDVYTPEQPPYLYVSEETLKSLYPDESTWGWAIGLRLLDPQAVEAMVAQVEAALHGDVVVRYDDWREIREAALFDVRMNLVFLGAFGFFAILATVLVIASSIGSVVLSQFRQIGVLKAIGFTRGQVLWLYLGQYLVLSLAGGCLGLLIGVVLSPLPLKSVSTSMNVAYRPPVHLSLLLGVMGILVASVLLATAGAAWRGSRANIIRSIAVGAEAPRRQAPWPTRLAARLGASIVSILAMNDLFARPVRSLMTGMNLLVGVVGIVFGLSINETVDRYREDPALLGIAHDAVVTRESYSDAKTRHILSRAPGVEAFYGEYRLEVETNAGETFEVKAIDGDLAPFSYRIEKGTLLRPDTLDAIAGQGLLDWLGLEVGDEIQVHLEDNERRAITWRIVGQYPEPANMGRMLMVNLGPIERLASSARPATYYLKLSPQADPVLLKKTLEPRPEADLSFTLVKQAIPDSVVYLQLAIYALSLILIGIALINVFNTSLLSVQEKIRVIGILKTVGMTPGQVVRMVVMAAGLLGFLATVVGIPLGLVLTRSLMAMLSANYGFGQVNVTANILYLLLVIPLIVVVSIAGSLIPGRRAATVSIIQVLRSE